MTVLGNIVAVTSIIAVVSLIQGLNASVKEAIQSEAGTDSFVVQRYPVTRTDEDFDRVRNNPNVTLQDMRAIQRYGGENIVAVMANNQSNARITYRDKSIDNTGVTGLTAGYVNFSGYDPQPALPHRRVSHRHRLRLRPRPDPPLRHSPEHACCYGVRLADGRSAVGRERVSDRQDRQRADRPSANRAQKQHGCCRLR